MFTTGSLLLQMGTLVVCFICFCLSPPPKTIDLVPKHLKTLFICVCKAQYHGLGTLGSRPRARVIGSWNHSPGIQVPDPCRKRKTQPRKRGQHCKHAKHSRQVERHLRSMYPEESLVLTICHSSFQIVVLFTGLLEPITCCVAGL